MKKKFFEKFRGPEKKISRSISIDQSDWNNIDAYRLYGASSSGNEIQLNWLVREIVMQHIEKDKDFWNNKEQWITKINNASKKES